MSPSQSPGLQVNPAQTLRRSPFSTSCQAGLSRWPQSVWRWPRWVWAALGPAMTVFSASSAEEGLRRRYGWHGTAETLQAGPIRVLALTFISFLLWDKLPSWPRASVSPSVKCGWDTSQTSQSRPKTVVSCPPCRAHSWELLSWGGCLRRQRWGHRGVGQGQDGARVVLLFALDDAGLFNFCLELDLKVNFVRARLRISCIFELLNVQQQTTNRVRSLPDTWSFESVS